MSNLSYSPANIDNAIGALEHQMICGLTKYDDNPLMSAKIMKNVFGRLNEIMIGNLIGLIYEEQYKEAKIYFDNLGKSQEVVKKPLIDYIFKKYMSSEYSIVRQILDNFPFLEETINNDRLQETLILDMKFKRYEKAEKFRKYFPDIKFNSLSEIELVNIFKKEFFENLNNVKNILKVIPELNEDGCLYKMLLKEMFILFAAYLSCDFSRSFDDIEKSLINKMIRINSHYPVILNKLNKKDRSKFFEVIKILE